MARPNYRFAETPGTEGVKRQAWFEFVRGKWAVAYRLVGKKGRPVIAEIRVYPTETKTRAGEWSGRSRAVPPGGLTARDLRTLVKPGSDLEALDEGLRYSLGLELGTRTVPKNSLLHRHGLPLLGLETGKPQPGIKRVSEIEHARLAAEFVSLTETGVRNVPTVLAKRKGVAPGTMRSKLWRLRDKGYLTTKNTLTRKTQGLLKEYRQ